MRSFDTAAGSTPCAASVRVVLEEREVAVEAECEAERQRTGRRVCGRRAVLAQSWRSGPESHEPRRNLRPRIAAASKGSRIEAVARNRGFVEGYLLARERWRDGIPVVFPPGTYWLRRFAQVAVIET